MCGISGIFDDRSAAHVDSDELRGTDWSSMAQSREVPVTFFDVPLLIAVAPWLTAHPGISKPTTAAAMVPQLAAALITKPKTGFTVPERDWPVCAQGAQQEQVMRVWVRLMHRRHAGKC